MEICLISPSVIWQYSKLLFIIGQDLPEYHGNTVISTFYPSNYYENIIKIHHPSSTDEKVILLKATSFL